MFIFFIIFYYAVQEEQISFYNLINEVDDHLKTHKILPTMLHLPSWIKRIANLISIFGPITFILFIFVHVFEENKHITLQLFSGMISSYRGYLGLAKSFAILDRFIILNDILKELLKQKRNKNCTVCMCIHLKRKTKLLQGSMCPKHTIL